MPEGDTIFRAAVALRKALLHEVLTDFESSLDVIREIDLRTPVVGRKVHAVEAVGKHLMMVFRVEQTSDSGFLSEPVPTPAAWGFDLLRGDLVLHTHMRMTGSWHIYRRGEVWRKPTSYARVVLSTKDFVVPCFSAPVVELLTASEAVRHPMLTSRGTDAITDGFDSSLAFRQLRLFNNMPVGVALMNQRAMAGVGNVFKSEVMYIQRINPFNCMSELDDLTLQNLIEESHNLLVLNRTRSARRTRFVLNERERLWVYVRSGEPCFTCGTLIKMQRQGLDGRSTYYCPRCQTGE